MQPTSSFSGFPKRTVSFLRRLAKNNDREWFAARKAEYEAAVMEPARAFVTAMGERLRRLSPGIRFSPGANGSIFRIYRDTRFSPDKTPYKTNLGIYFWEGIGPRLESSGFYFHIEPPVLLLGGGMYVFSKPFLARYRRAVADAEYGPELAAIAGRIARRPGFTINGSAYQRVPPGYEPAPEAAPLLLHGGLYAGWEGRIPAELHSPALIDYCFEKFKVMKPLHEWLVSLAQGKFKI
ncbi:MAG: DUF2461 domain-containing protein [Acidobacteria bacterium]|nr:DUF2461 domain-containing protein [Acidobacteriota bacterium]